MRSSPAYSMPWVQRVRVEWLPSAVHEGEGQVPVRRLHEGEAAELLLFGPVELQGTGRNVVLVVHFGVHEIPGTGYDVVHAMIVEVLLHTGTLITNAYLIFYKR